MGSCAVVTVNPGPSTSHQSELDSDDDADDLMGGFGSESDGEMVSDSENGERVPRTAGNNPALLPQAMDPDIIRGIAETDALEDEAILESLSGDHLVFDWGCNCKSFKGVREVFTGKPGPTFPVEDMVSPLNTFRMIFTDELIALMVRETNAYAAKLVERAGPQTPLRLARWKPVTFDEMWIFLGILVAQGIYPLPVEKEFWYPALDAMDMTLMKKLMPYNRFLLIKRHLSFADSSLIPPQATEQEKRLFRVQPVIDHLDDRFSKLYYPEREIALDESLLMWKGRLNFVQKISTKAAKVGVKSFEVCESCTGYLWKFKIYTGKSDSSGRIPDAGHTFRLVYEMVTPLLHNGHTLIMDNYYNSPLLARALKKEGMDCMGTIRINRQFVPDSMKAFGNNSNLRVGEVMASYTEDLMILTWRDTNIISMISTYHTAEVGGKEKYGAYKYKPKVVLDYNDLMGGVDKKDQLLSAFPIKRVRNLFWHKKLFRRLLNVSVQNAWILFSKVRAMTPRQFRLTLCRDINVTFCEQFSEIITAKQARSRRTVSRPRMLPFPELTLHCPEKGNFPTARCKACKTKRTKWQCMTCKVALCIECFKPFHMREP